jgi:hypothetical protein
MREKNLGTFAAISTDRHESIDHFRAVETGDICIELCHLRCANAIVCKVQCEAPELCTQDETYIVGRPSRSGSPGLYVIILTCTMRQVSIPR